MANKRSDETHIRKLATIGGKSIGLTLPIALVRALGWKEKQKVIVKRIRGGVIIRDWRER